jgi:tetratricopeptide (TPR) repeat protein
MGDSERTILSCQPLLGESYQREKAMMLGRAYFEERKYGQAAQELLKHIQKTGKLEETDPEVLFCYAESLILSDKAVDALPFLDKLTKVPALAEGEPRIRIGLMQSRCHQALKQTGQATEVLEHLLTISPPEALRDRLNHELSRLYLETGQPGKATEKLAQLAQSSNGLWKTAAEQELGYLELQNPKPKESSK